MSTEIKVPDIGDFDAVEVIEVLVSTGDGVELEQPLITLESDKATMEVPATTAGTVSEVRVKEGDKVGEGDVIVLVDATESAAGGDAAEEAANVTESRSSPEPSPAERPPPTTEETEPEPAMASSSRPAAVDEAAFSKAHASPAVRKYARELGVDLGRVSGSGPKGRILKEDVQGYVKGVVQSAERGAAAAGSGVGLPAQPEVDFSKFGETETIELSRIRKLSASALHKSWLLVPHVTQFDRADITELEAFRQELKPRAERAGVKVTMVTFLLKACAAALREFPDLNSSLAPDGAHLIRKHYCHIGVAVDTDNGLVVPVLRDVDTKSIFDLAGELGEVSERARAGKLTGKDLQGGCFSISSLGGVGGTAFTPIVNSPEVAILGASRAEQQPVWNGSEFVPRLMLPLSLSYDHRVIDGAQAARITTYLADVLGDIRNLLL